MAFLQYFISTCIVVIVQLTCPNTWINQYFHNCKICYRMQIYVYHYNELGWTWAWTSGTPRWVKWTCVVQNWVIFSMCTSVLCNTVGLMGDAIDKMNIYSKQPCFYMIYFCYISQYADLYYMCVCSLFFYILFVISTAFNLNWNWPKSINTNNSSLQHRNHTKA